jgi:hypothetical protein
MKRAATIQFRATVWVRPIDKPADCWKREVWGISMDDMLEMLNEFRLELQPGRYAPLSADFYTVEQPNFQNRRELGKYDWDGECWRKTIGKK